MICNLHLAMRSTIAKSVRFLHVGYARTLSLHFIGVLESCLQCDNLEQPSRDRLQAQTRTPSWVNLRLWSML